MVRSSSLVVVAALVGAHLTHAACIGECPSQDSSDSYLARGTTFGAEPRAVAEDVLDAFGGPVHDLMRKVVSGAESEMPSLMELEAHFEKMLTGNGNQSYNATNAEIEALKVVSGYVGNILKATVKAHDENQGELDGALALVKGCNTVAKTAVDGRLTTEVGEVTSTRGVHSTCRGDEGSLKDTRDDKCKTFIDKKEAFAAKRVAGTLSMCSGGSGDTSDTAITDGYDLLKDLKDKMAACNGATTTHSDKRLACGKNQSTYEKSRCFLKDQTEEVCNTLDDCYKKDHSYLTLRSQAVKSLEGIRKAEHVSATRVLCYIDILRNKSGDKTEKLLKCKDAVTVSHLSISYRTAPAKYTCVRVTSAPCDASWVKAEYTDQSWHAKANAEDCSACATVPPTPAPTAKPARPAGLLFSIREPVELVDNECLFQAEGNAAGLPMGQQSFTIEAKVDLKALQGKGHTFIYVMSWGNTLGKPSSNRLWVEFFDNGYITVGWGYGTKMNHPWQAGIPDGRNKNEAWFGDAYGCQNSLTDDLWVGMSWDADTDMFSPFLNGCERDKPNAGRVVSKTGTTYSNFCIGSGRGGGLGNNRGTTGNVFVSNIRVWNQALTLSETQGDYPTWYPGCSNC